MSEATPALPPVDELARAIGLVALADVRLECSLRRLAVVLSVCDVDQGRIIAAAAKFKRDFADLLKHCEKWLPLLRPNLADRAASIFSDADRLHLQRNRFVHDELAGLDDGANLVTQQFDFNKALAASSTPRTIDQVLETAQDLLVCSGRVDSLAFGVAVRVGEAPRTSPAP